MPPIYYLFIGFDATVIDERKHKQMTNNDCGIIK